MLSRLETGLNAELQRLQMRLCLCVFVFAHVRVCMTMWDHVKVHVSVKGLDSQSHCALESSLKAHYTTGLCELLVFTISRNSAGTAKKAALALLHSDHISNQGHHTLLERSAHTEPLPYSSCNV